jgi:hypothetical protein
MSVMFWLATRMPINCPERKRSSYFGLGVWPIDRTLPGNPKKWSGIQIFIPENRLMDCISLKAFLFKLSLRIGLKVSARKKRSLGQLIQFNVGLMAGGNFEIVPFEKGKEKVSVCAQAL